jgi:hypothetical protein
MALHWKEDIVDIDDERGKVEICNPLFMQSFFAVCAFSHEIGNLLKDDQISNFTIGCVYNVPTL